MQPKTIKLNTVLLILILLAVIGFGVYFVISHSVTPTTQTDWTKPATLNTDVSNPATEQGAVSTDTNTVPQADDTTGSVINYSIANSTLSVTGKNLTAVQLSGTPIDGSAVRLIGNATLATTQNGIQTWNFTPTREQIAGYDSLVVIGVGPTGSRAEVAGQINLPFKTDDDVYNAFYTDAATVSNIDKIIKSDWGISFTKPSDWNIITNTGTEIDLLNSFKARIEYITGDTVSFGSGGMGSAETITLTYNALKQTWMDQTSCDCMDNGVAGTAKPLFLLSSGLPVFGFDSHGGNYVIPLSHTTFLRLSTINDYDENSPKILKYIMNTITTF